MAAHLDTIEECLFLHVAGYTPAWSKALYEKDTAEYLRALDHELTAAL